MSITRNATFQICREVFSSKDCCTSCRKKSSISMQKPKVNENTHLLIRARLKSYSLKRPFWRKFHDKRKATEKTDALIATIWFMLLS